MAESVWFTVLPCCQAMGPRRPLLSKPFCEPGAGKGESQRIRGIRGRRGRTAVEVDHDFEAGAAGPGDGLVEDGELALHVWLAVDRGDGPVADWDTDVVHTSGGDLVEVILGDPGVPVIGKTGFRFGFAQGEGIGVFVDDRRRRSPITKDGRSDPWL